jgi:hypothetical protein
VRYAGVLALLGACSDRVATEVAPVRVTAYGRCAAEGAPPGSHAANVDIRSFDANDAPVATATTDANGVATLTVPAGGSVLYRGCSTFYEIILGVEPGDDFTVGDPNPMPQACSTSLGSMTVVFPTVANATSYTVNGTSSMSPSVVISGCNGAQVPVLGEAYDVSMQLIGSQFETVPFVDGSTVQLGALIPPGMLDLTVTPLPDFPPTLDSHVGAIAQAGHYRFVYPKIAPTCTVTWDERGGYNAEEPAASITIPTDQTSFAVDVRQLMASPYVATRFIGNVTNAAPTGDLEIYAEYLVDAPPGTQFSLQSLPIDVPMPSARDNPVNAFRAYEIRDNQYDDYGDFRNQRRHLDHDVQRSVLNTGGPGMVFLGGYDQWPTSR